MIQIKICGLTAPEEVRAVNEAGADYAGFVFYPESRRNVSPGQAQRLLSLLDPGIRSAAVCVSPEKTLLREIAGMGFDIIQIHGAFPEEALELRHTEIWQAVNFSDPGDLERIVTHPAVRGYVVDGAAWGSGKTFGWETAGAEETISGRRFRQVFGDRKFILAGGLTAENVRKGIELFRPDAVDVSSGVENQNGKDPRLIRQFINIVRNQTERG